MSEPDAEGARPCRTTVVCVICQEDFGSAACSEVKSCGHRFCNPCIERWAERCSACPLCKQEMGALISVRSPGSATRKRKAAGPPAEGGEERVVPQRRLQVHHSDEATDFLDGEVCEVCGSGDEPDVLLLCDTCDAPYHIYCLRPALQEVPDGAWHCPQCAPVVDGDSSDASDASTLTVSSILISGRGRPAGRASYLGPGEAGRVALERAESAAARLAFAAVQSLSGLRRAERRRRRERLRGSRASAHSQRLAAEERTTSRGSPASSPHSAAHAGPPGDHARSDAFAEDDDESASAGAKREPQEDLPPVRAASDGGARRRRQRLALSSSSEDEGSAEARPQAPQATPRPLTPETPRAPPLLPLEEEEEAPVPPGGRAHGPPEAAEVNGSRPAPPLRRLRRVA